MRKTFTIGIVVVLFGAPVLASAADKCPAELAQAKSMLNKAAASAKTTTTAPRQLAGARTQDVQAPRTASQDVQAPRTASQDVQAPRTGAQDVQAPRGQDEQATRLSSARKLIGEAEAACKKGDMATSSSKAKEAIAQLK